MSADPGASFDPRDVICEEIDPTDPPDDQDKPKRGPKQADLLVAMVREKDLFVSPDQTVYADIIVAGHRETWPVRSPNFRRWLTHTYAERYHTTPSSDVVHAALNLFEGRGQYQERAQEREVHLRVANHEGKVYIDLCDRHWRAIEVDANGWRVISRPPVRFRRSRGMQPLPVPVKGGNIKTLWEFLNVASNDDRVLVVASLVAALAKRGPFVILVLQGEPGVAKSTASKMLRRLVDPNIAPARRLPRDEQAFAVAIGNGYFLVFENISSLPAWASDALAAIATGSGYGVRELYTNASEILFAGMLPIILNGIDNVANRADLADRAIYLQLQPIKKRIEEKKLWADFDAAQPQIFGALLDAVACGLKNEASVSRENLPRMADFAIWGQACEKALWDPGTFLNAFSENQKEAVETVIEADPVASAVVKFMAEDENTKAEDEWEGIASTLLPLLTKVVDKRIAEDNVWPKTARALSGRLRRAAPPLRKHGIDITFPDAPGQRSAAQRTLTIKRSLVAPPPPEDDTNTASPNGFDTNQSSSSGWEERI